MIAAHKLSLKFASETKLAKITAVLDRYRACTNAYIKYIWGNGGGLNKATADAVPQGHLTFRQRGHALQQAIGIVAATKAVVRRTGQTARCPVFRGGMTLSQQLVGITPAVKSTEFDLWLRFSTLRKRARIDIPLKGTRHLRKLFAAPGAHLKGGCSIGGRPGKYWVTVWVESPDFPLKTIGKDLGIDVGLNKLLATSDGQFYGREMRKHVDRVRRRKPGSKGRRRAGTARRDYIGQTLNQLPWQELRLIAVERLKNLKKGKSPRRGKKFRKALAPWTYAFVMRQLEWKARQNRVQRVEVRSAYTSQDCPSCIHRARSNRMNEMFVCVRCGYSADADFVGSTNILTRAIGASMVPQPCTLSHGRENQDAVAPGNHCSR